jgi:hypothetical protein
MRRLPMPTQLAADNVQLSFRRCIRFRPKVKMAKLPLCDQYLIIWHFFDHGWLMFADMRTADCGLRCCVAKHSEMPSVRCIRSALGFYEKSDRLHRIFKIS